MSVISGIKKLFTRQEPELLSLTTAAADPPAAAGETTMANAKLSWDAAPEDAVVTKYRVYMDDAPAAEVEALEVDIPDIPAGAHKLELAFVNALGQEGPKGPPAMLRVPTGPPPAAGPITINLYIPIRVSVG